MLAEALTKLEELVRRTFPEPLVLDGKQYMRNHQGLQPVLESVAPALCVHTLDGLVGYCLHNHDSVERDNSIVLVDSPVGVAVYSDVHGPHRQRSPKVMATALVPESISGKWLDQESFIIALQTRFVGDGDYFKVLKVAGNVTDESAANLADDGVTQRATVKVGISLASTVDLPNPVSLTPFRSFSEVDQVASPFVFRMRRDNGDGEVGFMIAERDGGAWKLDAHLKLVAWLQNKLPNWRVIG